MVAPLIPLLSLGLTAAGTGISAMNASAANETNQQIGLLNYYEQIAARQRAEAEARRQQSEAKLGQTDAAGNRTYFVPGVGWVTDLSDTQQQIQDMSEQEQLRQLSQGARDERVQERANDRRNREDTSATEAEREFRAARRPDKESLRQLFLARGGAERNRVADRAGESVARSATRTGGTNAAAVRQGARAAADADSARQAGIDAALMASGEADRRFAASRDAPMQLYDYFRKMSTSGTGAGPVFQPQGPGKTSTASADQMLVNATSRSNDMPYIQPNNAMASGLADLGAGLQGYYDRRQQTQYNQDMLDAFARMGSNVGSFG